MRFQRTIKEKISCSGIGLHTGEKVNLTLQPAPVNSGIVFIRTDVNGGFPIKANIRNVIDTRYASTLGRDGIKVQTVEHLLAAAAGLGIDNLYVELDSSEIPIMDGSASPFIYLMQKAKIEIQKRLQPVIKVIRPVMVRDGSKHALIKPSNTTKISYVINFNHPLLKEQKLSYIYDERSFVGEIAKARTFGFLREVEGLRANGLAKGGSLDNAIVVGDYRVINEGGLRYKDEFVRHKILDSIGDLALLGMPVTGHFVANRSGHSLNIKLVSKLLTSKNSWLIVGDEEKHQSPRLFSPLELVVSDT
ncbi:MAG: UDP-3-O-acyl-N-acetylglucosamine deacetylase [Nitrospirota bacterium]